MTDEPRYEDYYPSRQVTGAPRVALPPAEEDLTACSSSGATSLACDSVEAPMRCCAGCTPRGITGYAAQTGGRHTAAIYRKFYPEQTEESR